jgi:hypothetical protein
MWLCGTKLRKRQQDVLYVTLVESSSIRSSFGKTSQIRPIEQSVGYAISDKGFNIIDDRSDG